MNSPLSPCGVLPRHRLRGRGGTRLRKPGGDNPDSILAMKWILLSEHPEEIARGAAFRLPAQRPQETVEFMLAELPPGDADRMGLTVTTGYEAGLWVVSCRTRRMRRDGRGRCPPRGCSCAACGDIGGFRNARARSRDFGGATPSSRVLRPIDAQDADQVEMPAPSVDQPDRQRTSSARTECCCETVLNRELRAVGRQGESSRAADRAAVTHDDRAPAGIAEGMKVGEWFRKA